MLVLGRGAGRSALNRLLFASAAGAVLTLAAAAQDSGTAPVDVTGPQTAPAAPAPAATDAAAGEAEGDETVVVTGSRLRRNTFNSASPVQVIDGAKSRELGLTDTSEILQSLNVASGVQVDTSISGGGFVTDGGPGSATIGLRNLDPERTLVLVDGRRLAPAGVEGAPVAPDANLIPSSMVERIEVLLDGASSVYGSDAVAGVVNVILRKNFTGFELAGQQDYTLSADGRGQTSTVSALWGHEGDGFNVVIGGEWNKTERLRVRDRDFGDACPYGYNREVDLNTGVEFNRDPRYDTDCYIFGTLFSYFQGAGLTGLYTPGRTNIDVPNFSSLGRIGNEPGAERVRRYSELYQGLESARNADMVPGIETWSLYANGDVMLDAETNTELFAEASYNRREQTFFAPTRQLFFEDVPASNPFNPVGHAAVGDLDGNGILDDGFDAVPILGIKDDRTRTNVEVEQMRFVFGVRGDLPFMNGGSLNNWTYEASLVYSRAEGHARRQGYRGDLLELSLFTTEEVSPGVFACGADVDPTLPACVPVNMFSASAMGEGRFSDAERAFLFDLREFDTTTEQILFNAYVAGDIFELQGGAAGLVFGVEYRDDKLDSIPDDNARLGRIQNTFTDAGASGSADIFEVFAEVELPFFEGLEGADELTVNLSGRFTEQEYYGQAWTYGAKVLYKPVEWFTLRGTVGTSYRAPNLREFFLAGQTGFILGTADPCVVPTGAIDPGPVYDPTGDRRSPNVIANCQAQGLDPFSLGLDGTSGIEVVTGGSRELEDETSEAFSVGFVLEQPFWEEVDLRIGLTYYEIEITNSIEEPTETFILDDCYETAGGSPFCDRITRYPASAGSIAGQIQLIDASFLNIGLITSRGLDYNIFYGQDVSIGDTTLRLTLDASASQNLQDDRVTFGDLARYRGTLGSPQWRGTVDLGAEMNEWRFLWRARYIGGMHEEEDVAPAFDTCDLINPSPSTARDPDCTSGENRVEKTFVESQWIHNVAFTYAPEDYAITLGVENVFDQDPEFVDPDVTGAVATTDQLGALRGVGYDFYGRRVYLRLSARF